MKPINAMKVARMTSETLPVRPSAVPKNPDSPSAAAARKNEAVRRVTRAEGLNLTTARTERASRPQGSSWTNSVIPGPKEAT